MIIDTPEDDSVVFATSPSPVQLLAAVVNPPVFEFSNGVEEGSASASQWFAKHATFDDTISEVSSDVEVGSAADSQGTTKHASFDDTVSEVSSEVEIGLATAFQGITKPVGFDDTTSPRDVPWSHQQHIFAEPEFISSPGLETSENESGVPLAPHKNLVDVSIQDTKFSSLEAFTVSGNPNKMQQNMDPVDNTGSSSTIVLSPIEALHQDSVIKSISKSSEQQSVDVPSYIQLCTELMERKKNPAPPSNVFTVRESSVVCQSNDSFSSLLTIMASTLIAQGSTFWRLQYQPTCELSDINVMTIQQLLPKDPSLAMAAGIEKVNDICTACLGGTDHSLACLGFPVEGINEIPINPTVIVTRILAFRHNVQVAAQEARRMEMAVGLPSSTTGGAVVYLDLESPHSRNLAMPLSWYAERIPVSASSIFVIVHQQCGSCVEHGQFVVTFLADMYPRAAVHFEILGSTALIFTRLMNAPYLLCPPTTACVLPALMRDVSTKSFIGDSPALYAWFDVAIKQATRVFHVQVEVTKADQVLARPVQDMADLYPYLVKQPNPTSKTCEQLRGRLGKWEFDPDYGKVAQYVTPLKRFESFPDFVPTEAAPFRLPTMYKWVDNLCPVDLVTKKGFCEVMKYMDLTRIYLVGDPLQQQMAMSLWKLLGNDDEPVSKPKDKPFEPWMRFNWKRVIECDGHQIDLQYTRNFYKSGERSGEVISCDESEHCMPWLKSYVDYTTGGTLLIVNFGSQIHDVDSFPIVLRTFLSTVDAIQRGSDLVMLRTTVPGHEKCEEPNVKPFENYTAFMSELVADLRSWHLFSQFNDHRKYDSRVNLANRKIHAPNSVDCFDSPFSLFSVRHDCFTKCRQHHNPDQHSGCLSNDSIEERWAYL